MSIQHEQLEKAGILKIIDPEKYGSLTELVRVTAYLLRYLHNLRNPADRVSGELTADEIKTAENKWVMDLQKTYFKSELNQLTDQKLKRGNLVKQLKIFIDDRGLIRCGSRVQNSSLPYDAKFPILLPDHHITRLIVLFHHRRCKHLRIGGTVTAIRQRYWIPKIRQVVKSVLRKCVTCAIVRGSAYCRPIPPPLPVSRVTDAPPFTVTGVDYSGEIWVRGTSDKRHKRYICLFTCATTRAVHLESVINMTPAAFIRAFRRFVSRRSLPHELISDNGSYFLKSCVEIEEIVNSPIVARYMANN
ncbi:uncharacterized protein LOC141905073 [Tubulanus polymorphus]|uniref:uncharacterized protein LOC141905073 n=1 Tax=Tubulanus polymorphus TaxID=672921 RepID=UPI003DA6C534